MSNHEGSHILNDILILLENQGFLDSLDQEQIQEFILEVIKIGEGYDCNNREILDGIGERLKICYYCLELKDNLDGICNECNT